MKKLILPILALVPLCVSARVEVRPDGHIVLGPRSATTPIRFTPDTDYPVTVISDALDYTGGLIAFGNSGNVKVGEERGVSNALYLYGYKGIKFVAPKIITSTLPGSDYTIFSYTPNSTINNTFDFHIPIKCQGTLVTSDARLKNSIEAIESQDSDGLSLLTPVSYYLNADTEGNAEAANGEMARKSSETEHKAHRKYGFLAQEVREVYPDLVYEDEEGMLSLDYFGFIPLLVESVQNLQAKVDRQEEIISTLTRENAVLRAPKTAGVSDAGDEMAVLCQNRPNPTSGATVIDYVLPSSAREAFIGVYDLNGAQKLHLTVTDRGSSQVMIEEGTLSAGLYIYNMVVDGQEIASYRMVVTD